MDLQSTETAVRRARKRLTHATRQAAREDLSARARARHQRRIWNAQRLLGEARQFWEELALCEMEAD